MKLGTTLKTSSWRRPNHDDVVTFYVESRAETRTQTISNAEGNICRAGERSGDSDWLMMMLILFGFSLHGSSHKDGCRSDSGVHDAANRGTEPHDSAVTHEEDRN